MDREDLERMALDTVSADNYYDLADSVDEEPDENLMEIIAAGGDVRREDDVAAVKQEPSQIF